MIFLGVKNSWRCWGFGLFSCWQLWFHEKICQKEIGWKTRENVGVLSKLNFWTKIWLFELCELLCSIKVFIGNCVEFNIILKIYKKRRENRKSLSFSVHVFGNGSNFDVAISFVSAFFGQSWVGIDRILDSEVGVCIHAHFFESYRHFLLHFWPLIRLFFQHLRGEKWSLRNSRVLLKKVENSI